MSVYRGAAKRGDLLIRTHVEREFWEIGVCGSVKLWRRRRRGKTVRRCQGVRCNGNVVYAIAVRHLCHQHDLPHSFPRFMTLITCISELDPRYRAEGRAHLIVIHININTRHLNLIFFLFFSTCVSPARVSSCSAVIPLQHRMRPQPPCRPRESIGPFSDAEKCP